MRCRLAFRAVSSFCDVGQNVGKMTMFRRSTRGVRVTEPANPVTERDKMIREGKENLCAADGL